MMPHSIEAEQAVLGGLMLENTRFDEVIEILRPVDFFQHDHQVIFKAISYLNAANKPFDVITVSEQLKQLNTPDKNILVYLAELAKNTPSTANIIAYSEMVKERSKKRTLMVLGQEITKEACKADSRSQQIVELADHKLFELEQQEAGQKDFIPLNAALNNIIDKIDKHFNSGNPITGVSTGLTDLDEITSGLQDGDLIIVGGRPSMGKTGFGMQIVLSAVDNILKQTESHEKQHVLVFSLEMPAEQLLMRCIAQLSGLNVKSVFSGQLNQDNNGVDEFNLLAIAMNKLNQYGDTLIIDDNAGLTTISIRSKTKRAARKYGKPALILIDYLQLIAGSGSKENRNNEVSAISRELKALAKEFNCPVIVLSQLNRSLENRTNKRPVNADLRDSGAIEQDADVIMFVYRDEVYYPESSDAGIAEIIIGKQRNGPTGTVRLSFIANQTAFKNLSVRNY